MVHDPRVTTLLSRLGGLYRDPSRIDRDAASLLKSSVGAHLTPGIAPLVENNGDSALCLVLQGTISIVFRGNTYQLLVDIYLPSGYPIRPPVSFVRLAPNMYLKENHAHVGSDGMVYMPYTHEWNPRTHSLIEMVVAMSSVFSADPPVFQRATPPAPPPSALEPPLHRPPPPPAYQPAMVSSVASGAVGPTSSDSERYIQQQIEIIMAREAEEANRAAEAARRIASKEEEEKEQMAAQKEWELKKRLQVREQVNQKIQAYLAEFSQQSQVNAQEDYRNRERLERSRDKIEKEIESLAQTKQKLESHIATVDVKTVEIQKWLEEAQKNSMSNDNNSEDKHDAGVDNLCQPTSSLHAQMLDLAGENAALTDALYFLDRAMYTGQLDCTTHLKSVRKLAKRQFLIRAHLIKINQVLRSSF
jgi:ESCRT-I complex subunit TSG101